MLMISSPDEEDDDHHLFFVQLKKVLLGPEHFVDLGNSVYVPCALHSQEFTHLPVGAVAIKLTSCPNKLSKSVQQ